MLRKGRWAGTVAALTLVMVSLAACGSNGDSSAPTDGDTEAPQEVETLTIATSGTFRPITFSEGADLVGYDIEVGNEIASRTGYEMEWVSGQLSGLLPGLNGGKFDVVMSGLTMTDERRESITFTEPYMADGTVAVVLKDSDGIDDITNIDGYVVGVIGGSGTQSHVESIGGYAELRQYPGAPEGFTDVAAGRIDAFAAGRIAAEDYIANTPDGESLEIVGELFGMMPAGVGLPKDDPNELKPLFDEAIAEMWADGTLHELQEKWFGREIVLPEV